MATKTMDAWTWVSKAASSDAERPALMGVCVKRDNGSVRVIATDGWRLHESAPGLAFGIPDGLFMPDSLDVIDAKAPDYDAVIKPSAEIVWYEPTTDGALYLPGYAKAASGKSPDGNGWYVTLPNPRGEDPVVINGKLLHEALIGMPSASDLFPYSIGISGPTSAVIVKSEGRTAIIMPVRVSNGHPGLLFSAVPLLEAA